MSGSTVHSIQIKFGAFTLALLLVACAALAWVATSQQRRELESAVADRGRDAASQLALAAQAPLRDRAAGSAALDSTLDPLVAAAARGDGVVAARLLDRDGRLVAAHTGGDASPASDRRLTFAVPVGPADARVGTAEVDVDSAPVVAAALARSRARLLPVAAIVVLVGLGVAGLLVQRWVRPLHRLRQGVEQLTAGEVMVRVPPSSRDEIGDLTRSFNELGDALAQKQRVQNAFGRYVDDYVLSQLLESEDGDDQAGIEREATILFADIRRFTRLSEGLDAPAVVALLNEIFQLVSDCILEQGGTIDKFIGDSVMAYFGAPVPHPDHAQRAVKAAVAIMRAIAARNASGDTGAARFGPVQLGIGVHLGMVVVGNIGSDRRTDFTAIGDAVNVAHRLEKLAQPGEILVSEAVQRRVRGAVRLRFEGERQLSGREEPVHVYALAEGPDGTPA